MWHGVQFYDQVGNTAPFIAFLVFVFGIPSMYKVYVVATERASNGIQKGKKDKIMNQRSSRHYVRYFSLTACNNFFFLYSVQALYTILAPYVSPFFKRTMFFHSGTLQALIQRPGSQQKALRGPLAGRPSAAGTLVRSPV